MDSCISSNRKRRKEYYSKISIKLNEEGEIYLLTRLFNVGSRFCGSLAADLPVTESSRSNSKCQRFYQRLGFFALRR